jgi:hypothetical protein
MGPISEADMVSIETTKAKKARLLCCHCNCIHLYFYPHVS